MFLEFVFFQSFSSKAEGLNSVIGFSKAFPQWSQIYSQMIASGRTVASIETMAALTALTRCSFLRTNLIRSEPQKGQNFLFFGYHLILPQQLHGCFIIAIRHQDIHS